MMSVLCSRKQQEIMFSKGAPESIMARCTHILCNDDGSSVPLTMDIRNELEARFQRLAFFMCNLSSGTAPSTLLMIILKYSAHISVVNNTSDTFCCRGTLVILPWLHP